MLVAASSVALTSCSKLGKLGAENFNVTPTPLEAIGGQVPATINGTFPTKYMKKKAEKPSARAPLSRARRLKATEPLSTTR